MIWPRSGIYVSQGQRSWCHPRAHGWFPICRPLSPTSHLSLLSKYFMCKFYYLNLDGLRSSKVTDLKHYEVQMASVRAAACKFTKKIERIIAFKAIAQHILELYKNSFCRQCRPQNPHKFDIIDLRVKPWLHVIIKKIFKRFQAKTFHCSIWFQHEIKIF